MVCQHALLYSKDLEFLLEFFNWKSVHFLPQKINYLYQCYSKKFKLCSYTFKHIHTNKTMSLLYQTDINKNKRKANAN